MDIASFTQLRLQNSCEYAVEEFHTNALSFIVIHRVGTASLRGLFQGEGDCKIIHGDTELLSKSRAETECSTDSVQEEYNQLTFMDALSF